MATPSWLPAQMQLNTETDSDVLAFLRDQVSILCASMYDIPLLRQDISDFYVFSFAQQMLVGVGGKELHCVGSGGDKMHNSVGVGVGGSKASSAGDSASASHSRFISHMHMHEILVEDKRSMMSIKRNLQGHVL